MGAFESLYEDWLRKQIEQDNNPRRRELLRKGLGHATVEYLRTCWHPTIGNLDHLYPEWEVRDFSGRLRYLDIAYLPGGVLYLPSGAAYHPAEGKGCVEIQGFRSHARDIEAARFKDLCMKQAMLALDDWLFLPVAYLSIVEDPELCRQQVLSFVGKFHSTTVPSGLGWAEAETLRFARRLLRPFTPGELALHLRISDRHTRRVLHELVERSALVVAGGKQRYRIYQIAWGSRTYRSR
ncbi:transcriptional regulator [Cohnella caldifontis]|uniref:transcriptional regulator n=1 Tax=Cohnella caldifontis TaxID=3027471 RepID=UPI0023EC66E7|nr:transcriptional regulator [Cohnella sp. YIM B05605]